MKIKLDSGAYIPERAHQNDAGLDLRSPVNMVVPARGEAIIDTGVHIQLPHGTVGLLKSRSGLNVGKSIVSGEGVIDEGYTGSIQVKLYNHGYKDHAIMAGDKITQLLVVECFKPDIEIVHALDDSERGSNGFGSTGR